MTEGMTPSLRMEMAKEMLQAARKVAPVVLPVIVFSIFGITCT